MIDDSALQTPVTPCRQAFTPLMKCRSIVKAVQSLGKPILICKMPYVHAAGKRVDGVPYSWNNTCRPDELLLAR